MILSLAIQDAELGLGLERPQCSVDTNPNICRNAMACIQTAILNWHYGDFFVALPPHIPWIGQRGGIKVLRYLLICIIGLAQLWWFFLDKLVAKYHDCLRCKFVFKWRKILQQRFFYLKNLQQFHSFVNHKIHLENRSFWVQSFSLQKIKSEILLNKAKLHLLTYLSLTLKSWFLAQNAVLSIASVR